MSSKRRKRVFDHGESSRPRQRIKRDGDLSAPIESLPFRSGIHQQHFQSDFKNRKVISGRWVLLLWFIENGLDFQELFDAQEWSNFVTSRCDSFPYLVKQAYVNFNFDMSEIASRFVKGKELDFYMNGMNVVAISPNSWVKFFESYTWAGMSDVEPIEILRVVLDNPELDEIVKPVANDFDIHKRLLHHIWVKKAMATPSQEIQEEEVEEEAEEEDPEEVEVVDEDRPEDDIPVTASPRTPRTPAAGRQTLYDWSVAFIMKMTELTMAQDQMTKLVSWTNSNVTQTRDIFINKYCDLRPSVES
ncbi:hypothetical protein CJ030_MR2G018732 [Morella rubra]|uniref:Uncharacterized protein n=1 Tax=Morella rubra TaxID=262757 RepID=A0A6A1WE33_9ROSI|nr:hypothetical protein CJ030_MR2G018732 [Morella rubra]